MTYLEYPKTDTECIAYASQVSENKGQKYHPIRLAPNNPYGVTHAICTDDEIVDYLSAGCELIK